MSPMPARAATIDSPAFPPRRREAGAALNTLDDRSLLALVLDRALDRIDIDRIAGDLLDRFESLPGVVAADPCELKRIEGMETAAIRELELVRQFSVRLARAAASRRPVLSSWSAVRDYARTSLAHLPREQFRALFLDRRNMLMRDEFVAEGSVDHAPVYPREVIRRALELSASALILVHNHPSGDPAPSQADIAVTRQIVDAARVFGLQVHDHLIVGREGTASFRALGLF